MVLMLAAVFCWEVFTHAIYPPGRSDNLNVYNMRVAIILSQTFGPTFVKIPMKSAKYDVGLP